MSLMNNSHNEFLEPHRSLPVFSLMLCLAFELQLLYPGLIFGSLLVQVFKSQTKEIPTYSEFLQRYEKLPPNEMMKGAMTDIGFALTQRVWEDLHTESRGSCFFCIGGVNSINPFSAKAVKNEILVYHDTIPKDSKRIDPVEGLFYDMSGKQRPELDLLQYDEIYMDFNGSMAFFEDKWRARLSHPAVAQRVRRMAEFELSNL